MARLHAQTCAPPPSDLVSWWAAEGDAKDLAGNSHGTTVNGVTYAPGQVGQAFSLSGSAYVQIPDSAALHMTTALTIEAWVKPAGLSTSFGKFITKDLFSQCGSPYFVFSLEVDQSGRKPAFAVAHSTAAGDVSYVMSSDPINVGQWSHLVATFDGRRVRIYVNGVLKGDAPAIKATLASSAMPLIIGRSAACGQGIPGLYDEVSVYSRALTAAEIAAVYSAGSAGKCKPFCGDGLITASLGEMCDGANLAGQSCGSLGFGDGALSCAGNCRSFTVTGCSQTCATPAAGFVSGWPGEGNTRDIVGSNHGAPINGVTYHPGRVGQAFRLSDGAYIQVPDAASLRMTTGLTLEAWVYPTDLSMPFGKFVTKDMSGSCVSPYFSYSLEVDQSGTRPAFSVAHSAAAGDNSYVVSMDPMAANQWSHVAGTFDGTRLRIYVNGVLQGDVPAAKPALAAGTPPLIIGRSLACGQGIPGLYDEVGIYNRALTAAEIAAIFSAGDAGKCSGAMSCPSALRINGTVPDFSEGTSQNVSLTLIGSNLSGSAITWALTGPVPIPELGTGVALNTVLSGLRGGRYTITATARRAGCAAATASTTFYVRSKFKVVITGVPDGPVCLGTSIALTARLSPDDGRSVSFNWTKDGSPFGGHEARLTDTPGLGAYTYSVIAVRDGVASDPASPVTVNVFDFALSVVAEPMVLRGGAASYIVRATPAVGSVGAPAGVSLTLSGLPGGISARDLPDTLPFDREGRFMLQTTDAAPLGDLSFTLIGTAGGCSKTAAVRLHMYDLTVTVGPASNTMLRGCSTSFDVTIHTAPGSSTFARPSIALGVASEGAAYNGVTTRFAVNDAPAPFVTMLTFASTHEGSVGRFPFRVTAKDSRNPEGGVRRSHASALGIYDLRLSALPDTLVLAQTQRGRYALTLRAIGVEPASPVELGPGDLPNGVAAVLRPAAVLPTLDGASVSLMILPSSPDALLPAGTFPIAVGTKNEKDCRRTISLRLDVVPVLLQSGVRGRGHANEEAHKEEREDHLEDETYLSKEREGDCKELSQGFKALFKRHDDEGLTLRATKPGHFLYHIAVQNTENASRSLWLVLEFPVPHASDTARRPGGAAAFELMGYRPVTVWDGDPCDPPVRNITPHDLTIHTMEHGVTRPPLPHRRTPISTHESVVIPAVEVPGGGMVWIQVRMRYALIGTAGWPADAPDAFVRSYVFKAHLQLGDQPLTNPLSSRLIGAGRKVTAIGGYALDVDGDGVGHLNVAVEATGASCSKPDATTEGKTGFYFIPLPAGTESVVRLYNEACTPVDRKHFGPLESGEFVPTDLSDVDPTNGLDADNTKTAGEDAGKRAHDTPGLRR